MNLLNQRKNYIILSIYLKNEQSICSRSTTNNMAKSPQHIFFSFRRCLSWAKNTIIIGIQILNDWRRYITLNILSMSPLWGFILFSFKKVYPKLNWSRDVKRSTSLNHKHENKLDIGVCALIINDPSGTSAKSHNTQKYTTLLKWIASVNYFEVGKRH